MALLDMSDIFGDPDFFDPVDVRRTSITVGSDGLAARTTTILPQVLMSIQPASGETLKLVPEALRVEGMLQVYTQTPLLLGSPTAAPDELDWNDEVYVLTTFQPYRNWGAGFFVGTLARKGLVPT